MSPNPTFLIEVFIKTHQILPLNFNFADLRFQLKCARNRTRNSGLVGHGLIFALTNRVSYPPTQVRESFVCLRKMFTPNGANFRSNLSLNRQKFEKSDWVQVWKIFGFSDGVNLPKTFSECTHCPIPAGKLSFMSICEHPKSSCTHQKTFCAHKVSRVEPLF